MKRSLIALCVCTYKRNQMVQRAVVSALKDAAAYGNGAVIIVDNDSRPENKSLIESLFREFPDVVTIYAAEARRGIVFARNRAIETALSLEPAVVGFIDDDEQLQPGWFSAMAAAHSLFPNAILSGPVAEERGGKLIRQKRRVRKTGETLKTASTNNVAIPSCYVNGRIAALRFDPFFNLTGGEDRDFVEAAKKLGAAVVRVEDACAVEDVHPSREREDYKLKRAYRVAINSYRITEKHYGRPRAVSRKVPNLFFRLMQGVFLLILGLVLRQERSSQKARRHFAHASGSLDAMLGSKFEHYLVTDGN